MILSKNNVEKLTQYVSTGDIIKVGTSTGISILINTIIASVHGSKLLFEDDDENFSEELYSIRTKKIIMYSNVIASSSNIIHTALSKNISKFDLGGFLVTCYRVFNDSNFIDKIKYEFLNSEVSTIYEEEVKGIELYYKFFINFTRLKSFGNYVFITLFTLKKSLFHDIRYRNKRKSLVKYKK